MADAKISALTELTTPVDADMLAIVDTTASPDETKRVTKANLLSGLLKTADIDDTPVDSETAAPVSSNWAFDHAAANSAHGVTIIFKSSHEAVNNSNVLQNDDDLVLPVAANSNYVAIVTLELNSGSTPDFKCGWDYPSGCSIWWGIYDTHWDDSATSTLFESSTLIKSTNGYCGMVLHLSISNGANAGNVTLKWAQNTANATDTYVLLGSNIIAFKVR